MNILDRQRRQKRSVSEATINNTVNYTNKKEEPIKSFNKSYFRSTSSIKVPRAYFFDSQKSSQYGFRQNPNANQTVNDVLKMNAKIKEQDEQQIQKSRENIQKSIVKDKQQVEQNQDRNIQSREVNQPTRVSTSQLLQRTNGGTVKFMKYYNFEDFIEKNKLEQLQKQYQQNQQQPQQKKGVVFVQKQHIMNMPQLKNIKQRQLTLQQKKAVQSAEEYYKYIQQRNQQQDSQYNNSEKDRLFQKKVSYDEIYEKVYEEQKQEEEEQAIIKSQYRLLKQKMLNEQPQKKYENSPKQTTVSVLKLRDEQDSFMMYEDKFEEEEVSPKQEILNVKFHKIQMNDIKNDQDNEFMKEIKINLQQEQTLIKIEAELGRLNSPEIVNMEIEILKETPEEFQQLEFKEIYDISETPNIKYIKAFNNNTGKEEIIEIFECSNVNSHLYYFKNIVLKKLLYERKFTPTPTILPFAIINEKYVNKLIIITVFPILIPLESIIHFRLYSKKYFPENQILTMMKSIIFKVQYLYENYRLSIGNISTDTIYLDCSDYQLKFFNLLSASIHIQSKRNNQYSNSSSLMKDCQELGQCFFMLKNLMSQKRINEKSDFYQIEQIQQQEENRDEFSSEIILELLKVERNKLEDSTDIQQESDPFKNINIIFQKDISEQQFEIVDFDFKKLEIFMNARILKDNQTISLYYYKTLQHSKALSYKQNKTSADKQEELQICLETWKKYFFKQEYKKCEQFGDTYLSNFEDPHDLEDNQKNNLADIFSKQAGVKITLGKQNEARSYLLQGLKLYSSLNARYSPACIMILIELSKLDLIYENVHEYEEASRYLFELYFSYIYSNNVNDWNENIVIQLYELLILLASKLNVFEIQPYFYNLIIKIIKSQMQANKQTKSNQLVSYYIKCADSHLEYQNYNDVVNQLDNAISYAENQEQNEKISLKKLQVKQEIKELSNKEQLTDEDLEQIQIYKDRVKESLIEINTNQQEYIDSFEDYFKYVSSLNKQIEDIYIQDLIKASQLLGGEHISQPQKAQKYLLKALEYIYQSEKFKEYEKAEKKLDIFEKIGKYSLQQDQELIALVWYLLCSLIRRNQLNDSIEYDDTYLEIINNISKCAQRLNFNYTYLIIQKNVVQKQKSEEEQLKILMNMVKMNAEIANLNDGFDCNQQAMKIAEKLQDQESIEKLKTYKISLITKTPDSEEAKEYMEQLRSKISNHMSEEKFSEASELYYEYFKILEAQKEPLFTIQTVEEYNEYADLIWKSGDKKKAMTYFKKGLKVQVKLFTMNDANTMKNMKNVAVLYFELEMFEDALVLFEDILKSLRRNKKYNSQYYQSLEYESKIYKAQKNIDQSLISLHEYHDMIQKFPLKNNKNSVKIYEIAFEIDNSKMPKPITEKPCKQGQICKKYYYEYSQCLFQVSNLLNAHIIFKEQIETWRRLKSIKCSQMTVYLDDYHQLFLKYSNMQHMYDILLEIKQNFELKHKKTSIQTNDFYKVISIKLVQIELNYKNK